MEEYSANVQFIKEYKMNQKESYPNSRFDNIPEPPSYSPGIIYQKYYADNYENKYNLKSIAYKDEDGNIWQPQLIERIKLMLVTDDCLKNGYLPAIGLSKFNEVTAKIILGKTSPAILENKIINIHTPTKVCSIKVAATFLLECLRYTTLYLSMPYDEKTKLIFEYSGYTDIRCYTYWSNELNNIDFDGLKNDLEFAPENSIIFLYVNAQNPTCYDLTNAQWDELSDIIKVHKLYPFFYSENLGICSGNVGDDAYSIRLFVKKNIELMCVQNFESSFCLYRDRASTLMLYTLDSTTLINLKSSLTKIGAALYSSPNTQGARIITCVLNCAQFSLICASRSLLPALVKSVNLTAGARSFKHANIPPMNLVINVNDFRKENIKIQADRIMKMRKLLRSALELLNTPGNWSILTEQSGIFAYIPLNETQVNCLMDKYHIYLNHNGRLNITAINNKNIDFITKALNDVIINLQ